MAWSLLVATALTLSASPSQAQKMFLDCTGDGHWSPEDRLNATGTTSIDVWLITNVDSAGVPTSCATDSAALTINSYELILHAVDGTVNWEVVTNAIPQFNTHFGEQSDSTDLWMGWGAGTQLPAGPYRLATLVVTVRSGSPSLRFAISTPLSATALTSFGSACPGSFGDNTLRYGVDWTAAFGAGRPTMAPEVMSAEQAIANVGTEVLLSASAIGADNDQLAMSAEGYPSSLSFNTAESADTVVAHIAGVPVAADVAGSPYTIRWYATNESGDTAQAHTELIILANYPPTLFAPPTIAVTEGALLTFQVSADDPDGDWISSFTVDTHLLPQPNDAALILDDVWNDSGRFSWRPGYRHAGTYKVTFTVTARGMSTSGSTWITVVNESNPPPWATRSVRIQLPGRGYKAVVRYYDHLACPNGGVCRLEELTAGDSGQVYVPARWSNDPDDTLSPLWDLIRVEFPAMNSAAYITRKQCPESWCELLFDDMFIANAVEWYPSITLPPYAYSWDQSPTALSPHFIRLLNKAQSIADFYWQQYAISRSRVEIRLWNNLTVPRRWWYTTVFESVEMIHWPDNPERYGPEGSLYETYALAHEWAHMIQSEVIYQRMQLPGGIDQHNGCDEDADAETRWNEGTANALAELYLVNHLGLRHGTTAYGGTEAGPGKEFISGNWFCPVVGGCIPEREFSVSFYFYLMSRLWPREAMSTWRYGQIIRPSSPSPDIVSSVREFHNLWNDRQRPNAFIYSHVPGPVSDDAIYALAVFCNDAVAAYNSDPHNAGDPNIVTGVGEVETYRGPTMLNAYPNPSRGGVHLVLMSEWAGPLEAEMFDVTGRRVRRITLSGKPGRTMIGWDGRDDRGALVGNGVYFARFSNGGRTITARVVLIK